MPMPDAIDVKLYEVLFDCWKQRQPPPAEAVVWAGQIKARHAIGETARRCGVGSARYLQVEEAERRSLEFVEALVGAKH